ncbi:MAG: VCBS repeat-containing protein, partial [Chryseolinea sp.]
RMKWIMVSKNKFQLVVVPLHGRGNKDGSGKGVKIFSYERPKDPKSKWKLQLVDSTMHLTHNLEIVKDGDHEIIYIAGREGIRAHALNGVKWSPQTDWIVSGSPVGEVRTGGGLSGHSLVTAIQPMHGNSLTVYGANKSMNRITITSALNQGHALAIGGLEGRAGMMIVAGWREPDKDGKVGIKIFKPIDADYMKWDASWIDDNGMACEDLQLADLNGDGKLDIIASGRSTHNLKIYWNRN